jgi:hypothetical protein
MPTINDATVVASAYDTSGNGGRKLVRLSNGWFVSAVWDSTNNQIKFFKSIDGVTWVQLTYFAYSGITSGSYFAISSFGTTVYIVLTTPTNTGAVFHKFDATTVVNTDIGASSVVFISGNTSFGSGISLVINDNGTEIHGVVSSKMSTYASSFNIRYAKGTINADGSVTWGAVEQRTTINTSGQDVISPTITVKSNGYAVIIWNYVYGSTSNAIGGAHYNGSTWSNIGGGLGGIYTGGAYAQSSPSAIFVPQSINGLANGRIWAAWYGSDASTTGDIRVSYSDDGGVTWSAMQKLTTTGSQDFPSITANKNNEIFILFRGVSGSWSVRQLKYSGSWGAPTTIKTAPATSYPSALYDQTLNFTSPLFIYKDVAKVGFYGTWSVTTISVTQGAIGQKTDKTNLLSYVITTDGTMSTITEKVNGVTVGTKTATSGQSLIAGITQAQWDAIKYGKYADATGGLNTLTVTMGSDIWTYTFDKRLATDADILSAVKAVQDSQNPYLPAVKAKLASAVRGKGGTVNDTDSFDAMVSAVIGMPGRQWAGGSFTANLTAVATQTINIPISPSFVPRLFFIQIEGTIDTQLVSNSTYLRISNPIAVYDTDSIFSTLSASGVVAGRDPSGKNIVVSITSASNSNIAVQIAFVGYTINSKSNAVFKYYCVE